MMFTRTITTYQASAYRLFIKDGSAQKEELGSCTFECTTPSKTEARKALQDMGYAIPKGAAIDISPVESVTYGCTIEDFMSVAHPIERKAAQE